MEHSKPISQLFLETTVASGLAAALEAQSSILEGLIKLSTGTCATSDDFAESINQAIKSLDKGRESIEELQSILNEKLQNDPAIISLGVIRKARE